MQSPEKKQSWCYDLFLNLPSPALLRIGQHPIRYASLECSAAQLLRQRTEARRAAGEAKINQERRQQRDRMMEERVNVSSEPEKPKLYSITFIKQRLQWLKSVWLFPAAANLITCSTSHKTSSAASEHRRFSSGEKWLADGDGRGGWGVGGGWGWGA